MQFDMTHIAAWIIITASIYWLLELRQNEVREGKRDYAKRVEEEAARLEFEDDQTSEHRKQELLMRYAEVLVRYPNLRFVEQAKEIEREYERPKLTWKERLGVTALIAIIGLISLVFAFGAELLISLLKRLV
jgi:hypothetical protein